MNQTAKNVPMLLTRSKPEQMVTLVCKACKMALYMSDRELHKPTWQCPSCGMVTKTVTP